MGAGRGHLLPAGGGGGWGGREGANHLSNCIQLETLASCPTVEEEQGSYDKLT